MGEKPPFWRTPGYSYVWVQTLFFSLLESDIYDCRARVRGRSSRARAFMRLLGPSFRGNDIARTRTTRFFTLDERWKGKGLAPTFPHSCDFMPFHMPPPFLFHFVLSSFSSWRWQVELNFELFTNSFRLCCFDNFSDSFDRSWII